MIQIHQPEVEALIQHRLTIGGFRNVEEVLLQALQDAPLPRPQTASTPPRTGADLLAALMNSPYKEVNLEPERHVLQIDDWPLTEDRIIEQTEDAEVVIGKSSHVVEEVHVGKSSTERTEAIHDTVRKTEVEVEEITPVKF